MADNNEINFEVDSTVNVDGVDYIIKDDGAYLGDEKKEATGMDEVLFTGEQPASDPVVEQPLQDAVQDLTVTLTDVDWDIDSIIAKASEPDMSKDDLFALIQNLPNQVTVSLRDVEISDNPMMIKQAILKAANEQTPYQINNATIATVQ